MDKVITLDQGFHLVMKIRNHQDMDSKDVLDTDNNVKAQDMDNKATEEVLDMDSKAAQGMVKETQDMDNRAILDMEKTT